MHLEQLITVNAKECFDDDSAIYASFEDTQNVVSRSDQRLVVTPITQRVTFRTQKAVPKLG